MKETKFGISMSRTLFMFCRKRHCLISFPANCASVGGGVAGNKLATFEMFLMAHSGQPVYASSRARSAIERRVVKEGIIQKRKSDEEAGAIVHFECLVVVNGKSFADRVVEVGDETGLLDPLALPRHLSATFTNRFSRSRRPTRFPLGARRG